jgi:hypothetical protein
MKLLRIIVAVVEVVVCLWLLLEIGLRIYVESPLKTDFYGSIARGQVRDLQERFGIKIAGGAGWIHLGWIADPENETYIIENKFDGLWKKIGETNYGSFLVYDLSGKFRIIALAKNGRSSRILGEVSASTGKLIAPIYKPVIAGPWKPLFRPETSGYYINDHTVFQDAEGNWRLLGITHRSDGNYSEEKYFASGFSAAFPPAEKMLESDPVADFGELAWAPDVIDDRGTYFLFWSPHRLERMMSKDGINWSDRKTVIQTPFNKFFRDAMIFRVTGGQWLLYTTARSLFFSQVDLYQSFDLEGWQYIGSALQTSWGSERNSPFASTESPFLMQYKGRYYLSITYNNDTFFWNGLLLPFKIWPDRASYNETLVFQSDNPYDFGVYRGKSNTSSLLTTLEAHAPEYVFVEEKDQWYITTAGWPWISTLTSGEVAYAPLTWEPLRK